VSELSRRADRAHRASGWSGTAAAPVRRLVLGVCAALVSAAACTAFVIVTGYDYAVFAVGVGSLVGWCLLVAGPMSRPGLVKVLAIVVTVGALVLTEYLLLWFWDGEGLAPLWVPLPEATVQVWRNRTADPVGFLFWGFWAVFGLGAAVLRLSGGGGERVDRDDRARTADRPPGTST
jgi:hypothetical protein